MQETWPGQNASGMGAPVPRRFMPRLEKLPELAPARENAEQGSSPPPLSQVLWGFSWSDILPYRIGSEGVVAIGSTFDRALPFIHSHYAEIFHEDPAVSPFVTKVNAARQRYYRAAGDFFEFVHEGR